MIVDNPVENYVDIPGKRHGDLGFGAPSKAGLHIDKHSDQI